MTELTLHLKYRPTLFKQVLGQGAITKSLTKIIENKKSQAFLFHGTPGLGKTTLARIVAKKFGTKPTDVLEICAAENTGVDDMRRILDHIRYKPWGDGKYKAVILDECHRLTIQAWESLLKAVEEPPPYVLWMFCTTNSGKVPEAIKSRCSAFGLKPLKIEELDGLITDVIKKENIQLANGVQRLIVHKAKGSPRQALVYLGQCIGLSKEEAAKTIEEVLETNPVSEMCRLFLNGSATWQKAMKIFKNMESEPPESVRIGIVNYMGAVLRNADSDEKACKVTEILDHFTIPYTVAEKSMLLISISRALFAE
jgi:DNA polymerase III subunit gamma/tau